MEILAHIFISEQVNHFCNRHPAHQSDEKTQKSHHLTNPQLACEAQWVAALRRLSLSACGFATTFRKLGGAGTVSHQYHLAMVTGQSPKCSLVTSGVRTAERCSFLNNGQILA